jgi:hypothetical protein
MQTYKLDSKHNNIKFHKWKIQIGTKLSKGTILFLYQIEGILF